MLNSIKERKKEKGRNFFNFITVFFLIYCSNDTLLFGTNKDARMVYVATIVLIIVGILHFFDILIKKIEFRPDLLLVALFLCVLSLTTMFINKDFNEEKYLYEIILIALAFIIITNIQIKCFLQMFFYVVCLLSVWSLVVFVFKDYLVNIDFPLITNENEYTYKFCGLSFLPIQTLSRNFGIFREPGVYQIYLNLAIIFGFSIKKLNVANFLVLAFTVFTTKSTAGYILFAAICVFCLLLSCYRYEYKEYKKTFISFLLIAFSAVLVGIFFDFYGLRKTISDVILKIVDFDNPSFISRFEAFFRNILIWLKRPFFGVGFSFLINHYDEVLIPGMINISFHNTNTFLKILSLHGLIYFTFMLVGIYRFCNFLSKEKKGLAFILCIIVFLMFSNEDMTMNVLLYLMGMYFITSRQKQTKVCYENLSNKFD